MAAVWTLLCLAVLAGLAAMFGRRDLVRRAARVRAAWAPVETELKRRHGQVSGLVQATSGGISSRDETTEAVFQAWREATGAAAIPDRIGAENRLSYALGRLLARLEASDDALLQERLQTLAATGRQIAAAAREYNLQVMALNEQLHRFPWRLVARGFRPAEYLILDEPGESGSGS